MDIVAHALWAVTILPGPPTIEKAIFAILPDIAVFLPDIVITAWQGNKRDFRTRKEMMIWYSKPENSWKITLYKCTHSLPVWFIIIGIACLFFRDVTGTIPWFLFASPLHILMDIPTHTKDSFPVEFLTPFSKIRVNGWHWSNKTMIFTTYFLIIVAFYVRLFVLNKF
jgi:hypothetical protein